MIEYLLAAAAGVATVLSPCILPILPIVLATTAGQSRSQPLLIVIGFTATFAAGGIALGTLAGSSGQAQDAIRTGAILLLLIAGIVCVWSRPFDWLSARVQGLLAPFSNGALGPPQGVGPTGPLLIGASLGVAWTPCAGPVLASVLALAASAQAPGKSTALLGLYAIGAGVPMLAIAYGGNWVSSRLTALTHRADLLRKGFGAIAIAVAILQLFRYDIAFTAWVTQWLPAVSTGI